MSGWSRTTKPSADTTISAGDIYGVDRNEIAVTEGIAQVGWVKRTTVGSRVKHEVLVAMKTPPVEDNADDSVLPDTVLAIGTQPASRSDASGSAVDFSVVATATPTATISYVWERSLDSGSTWVTVDGVIDSAVYSDFTTDTLAISDNTGLDTYQYRVLVSAADTGAATLTSDAATLTETA